MTVSLDFANPAGGNKLLVSDLSPGVLDDLSTVSATGSVVASGDVDALAVLPGLEQPFTLASATLTVTWDDIADPVPTTVALSVGLSDYLKVKAQELLDLLRKIRSLTEQINSVLPPEFQGGLSSVIGVLNKLDEIITSVLADFETTLPTFKTIRDLANSVAEGLNQEVGPFQIGLEGTTLFVTFTIDDVTLSSTSLGFAGLGATLNDLRVTLGINLLKLIPVGTEFSISNALSFEISGEVVDINLFDVLTGGAKFEAGRSILDVDLPDTADDLANAQLLTFGLDLDEDVGVTDETYFLRVGSEGFALEIEDGSLAVGIISAPEPTTPATDTRRWIAVQAAGLSGSLGLGELFTAVASGIDVLVNSASGVVDLDGDLDTDADQTFAAEIDWTTALDRDQDGNFGEAAEDDVVVQGHTIDRTSAGFSIEGDIETIDILGFVSGTARFAISKSFVNVQSSGGPDAMGATLLEITLTEVGLTIGGAGGPTFTVTSGELYVAAITPVAPTDPATDDREWLAVTGGPPASFNGIDGLTMTVTT